MTKLRDRLLARTMLISPRDPAERDPYKIFPSSALPVASFGADFPSIFTDELRHIPGTGATGQWATLGQQLVVRNFNTWENYTPEEGWTVVASGIAWVYRAALGTWQVLAGPVRSAWSTYGWSGSVTGLVTLNIGVEAGNNNWYPLDTLQDLATGVTGFRLAMTGASRGMAGTIGIAQGITGGRKMIGFSGGSGWSTRMMSSTMNPTGLYAGGGSALVTYEYVLHGATGICMVSVAGDAAPSF